jgi:hypothetical protein
LPGLSNELFEAGPGPCATLSCIVAETIGGGDDAALTAAAAVRTAPEGNSDPVLTALAIARAIAAHCPRKSLAFILQRARGRFAAGGARALVPRPLSVSVSSQVVPLDISSGQGYAPGHSLRHALPRWAAMLQPATPPAVVARQASALFDQKLDTLAGL